MNVKDPLIQRSISDIVLEIKKGNVIPIIGYDLLYSEFDGENPDDFLKQIIKLHAKEQEEVNNSKILESLGSTDEKTGYELINAYYHSLDDNDLFKQQLSETIKKQRYNRKQIPESFRKLASISNFKLFVNATFTNTLELAINKYRAKGKTEKEMKDSYKIYKYHPNESTDLPEVASQKNFKINFDNPVIYNLFGTHDDDTGAYVLTDADYVELIYDLIENKQQSFTNLLNYLNGGYLLFLGCNFPDWFFRFFIRVSLNNRLEKFPVIKGKSVVDSLVDTSRSVFISHYKIKFLSVNCNELVDEIYKRLKDQGATIGSGDEGNNNIFISYCRKDEQVAKDIAKQFDEKYIEYFLDSDDLNEGDNLNDKITDAIDRCCLFLPVVSHSIGSASKYIWMEWKYAFDAKKKIWPFFKDFVDPDMLLPKDYGVSDELKNKILNKNNTLGIKPEGENNKIPDTSLQKIKSEQYHSRVSDK